jgi:hypothetical protein
LLRALFVDGASYSSSDFMIKLLNFAFMLRNAGLDDQRLVEHLSEATAGSLTGELSFAFTLPSKRQRPFVLPLLGYR